MDREGMQTEEGGSSPPQFVCARGIHSCDARKEFSKICKHEMRANHFFNVKCVFILKNAPTKCGMHLFL